MLKVTARMESNSGLPGSKAIIGKLDISNVSHTDPLADYKVVAFTCDGRHSTDGPWDEREFVVTGYDRRQGFWCLVKQALEQLTQQMPPTGFYEAQIASEKEIEPK